MKAEKVKEIAAGLLKVGKNKIWIDPEEAESVKEAITKDDVRELIKNGIIKKRKENEQSRGRARKIEKQKKKGRRKGHGSRRGTAKARTDRKADWINKVRAQRALLKELREKHPDKVKKLGYSKLYRMIKGGFFRSKAQLERFVMGAE
ncbi:MAG: 50S ribosomal protein L19e [Candidatus Diapherotrites archaeon]|nr:50S ribosomal protein L19e [Candidatus Diapherotrites archaeon]